MVQRITREIRHTPDHPCPVCGGHDADKRGEGRRCGGWTDGDWCYCQRPAFASGRIPYQPLADTYRHRLSGTCLCGQMHGGNRPASEGYRQAAYGAPVRKGERGHGAARARRPKRLTDVYDYRDATGALAFQVLRYVYADGDKTFRQRRPWADGEPVPEGAGPWCWTVVGLEMVPYRLPELLAADPALPVYIVEGEKHVDRLRAAGLVATCNPMGAGKWWEELTPYFAGRRLVILPDNDEPGECHAAAIGAAVADVAAEVKIVHLPDLPPKGDVLDWFAAGGTPRQLSAWAGVWPASANLPATDAAPAAVDAAEVQPAPASVTERCRGACQCCAWRRQVVKAAKRAGSRQVLPIAITIDDHLRRRELSGYSVELGFRVSTAYRAREAGVSAGTYLSTVKWLSDRGVLTYWKQTIATGSLRPDGVTRYSRPENHSYVAVPGGPDAFLARVAALPDEADPRGGRRPAATLPACAGCGSVLVSLICEDCGEFQSADGCTTTGRHRPALTDDPTGFAAETVEAAAASMTERLDTPRESIIEPLYTVVGGDRTAVGNGPAGSITPTVGRSIGSGESNVKIRPCAWCVDGDPAKCDRDPGHSEGDDFDEPPNEPDDRADPEDDWPMPGDWGWRRDRYG